MGATVMGFVFLIGGILGFVLYFLPSIIAFKNHKTNSMAILALNFFLGWTVLGWVLSLVWAISSDNKPQQIIINNKPATSNTNTLDDLSKLKTLLDNQVLTTEEYEKQKSIILGRNSA